MGPVGSRNLVADGDFIFIFHGDIAQKMIPNIVVVALFFL